MIKYLILAFLCIVRFSILAQTIPFELSSSDHNQAVNFVIYDTNNTIDGHADNFLSYNKASLKHSISVTSHKETNISASINQQSKTLAMVATANAIESFENVILINEESKTLDPLSSQAKPVESYKVNLTDAICNSDGVITVEFPDPGLGNTYEAGWIVELKNLTNTNSTPSSLEVPTSGASISFNSLGAADYRLEVKNGSVVLESTDHQIVTTYQPMVVNPITDTLPTCPGGDNATLTLTVSGGVGPFVYSLRSTVAGTNTVVVDGTDFTSSPTSDRTFTFTNLKDGDHFTYSIADDCGSIISANRQLIPSSAEDLKFAVIATNFIRECSTAADGTTDCTSVKMFVNLDRSTMTPERLAIIQTEGNATIKINGTLFNLVFSGSTPQAHRFTYVPVSVSGPVLKNEDQLELAFNWGCKTLTKSIEKLPMRLNAFSHGSNTKINPSTCETDYVISIFGSGGNPDRSVFYCAESSQIKIERIGENGALEQIFPETGDFGRFPTVNENDILSSLSISHTVQEAGNYRLTVSDDCQTRVQDINIPVINNPVAGIDISSINGVAVGTAGIKFTAANDLEYQIKITPEGPNPPESIVINAGSAPLNYNPTSKEITFPYIKSFRGPIELIDFPLGSYKVELSPIVTSTQIDGCTGSVAKTEIINLTTEPSYEPSFNVIQGCDNSNTITFSLGQQNAFAPDGVVLFSINPNNGSLTSVASSSSLSGLFTNLPGGDYSIRFNKGGNFFFSALHDTRGAFNYSERITIEPSSSIELGVTTVFCDPTNGSGNTGNISVSVVSGTLLYPLSMTLLDQNNVVVREEVSITAPQTEHVFMDLSTGNYKVKVSSVCSTVESNFQLVTATPKPVGTASQNTICMGSSTILSANNATNLLYDIEWFIVNSDDTRGTRVGEGIPLTVEPEESTTYEGVFILKEVFSCDNTDRLKFVSRVKVIVLDDPLLDLTVSNIEMCESSSRAVTISNSESGFKYEILDKLGNSYSPIVDFVGTGADLNFELPERVELIPGESLLVRTTRIAFGCTGILSDKIFISRTLPAAPSISGSAAGSYCANEEVKLTSSAENGIQWFKNDEIITGANSKDLIVSSSGVYTLITISNSGCQSTVSEGVEITINNLPEAPIVGAITQATCNNPTASVSLSGLPSGDWQITRMPGNVSITGNTSSIIFAELAPDESYTFTVKNSEGCTSLVSANVIINSAPKITADFNVSNINVPVVGNLSTNDVLPAAGITYGTAEAGEDNPEGAEITVNAAGTYTFIATLPGVYTYIIPISTSDQLVGCSTSTLQITVLDPSLDDNLPIVNPDLATTKEGVAVAIPVLSNDASGNAGTMLDAGSLTITEVPVNGQVTINEDGTVTYTPVDGFTGTDIFTYSVCDDADPANCQTGTVSVTVLPKGMPDVTSASDDFAIMTANALGTVSVTGNVLTNDFSTDSDAELKARLVTNPDDLPGKFDFNEDGTYTFTPEAGFSGPLEVIYTVCDDASPASCATATLHILVRQANLLAVDDTLINLNGVVGINDAGNVLSNDKINGLPISIDDVNITINKEATPISAGSPVPSIDPTTGVITVPENTPAGTYIIDYKICEIFNSDNCQTAVLTMVVESPTIRVSVEAIDFTFAAVGDNLEIAYAVSNTGTVTLFNVVVKDPTTGFEATLEKLEPRELFEFPNFIYTVVEVDFIIGFKDFEVEALGLTVDDFEVIDKAEDFASKQIIQEIDVKVTASTNVISQVGQVIIYTYEVINIGNTDIGSVTVLDSIIGLDDIVFNLLFGMTTTFTVEYVVTQEDIDRGLIENVVIAEIVQFFLTGENTGKAEDDELVRVAQSPALTILKESVHDNFFGVGEVLTYSLTVTNTGNVTLRDIEVSDPLTGLNQMIASLSPDSVEVFTTTYTVQQADFDGGVILNRAIAASTFNGVSYEATDSLSIDLSNISVDLAILKTSNEILIWEGDEFDYEIRANNIGGTDATEVVIEDILPAGVLFVSQSATSTDSNVIINFSQEADVLRWTVANFPADATLDIKLRVSANALSSNGELTIFNFVSISSEEQDVDMSNNSDSDLNRVGPFFIPNVISPDGDGKNDRFEIKGLDKFESNSIVIFNRYGDHVFEADNYKNNWDARGLPVGTFYYVLKTFDFTGKDHVYKGWVLVVNNKYNGIR